MKSVSKVPEAVDALVLLARTALATAGVDGMPVQVIDGPPIATTEDDVVAIGFTGNPGEAAVESTRTVEQLNRDPDRESFEITCLSSSWRGSDAMKPVRDQAYEFIDLINEAIMQDPTMGGVVARTQVRSESVVTEQTDRGPVATVLFVVGCDAYTRGR